MEQVPWGLVEAAQAMGADPMANYLQSVIAGIVTYD